MKHMFPLILGKQIYVGDMKSHLPPLEIYLPDQNPQNPLEDVAVDGEYISTLGLFRIWSICWAESLRLGKEKEKEMEFKNKFKKKRQNAGISQGTRSQKNSCWKGPQELSSPTACLKL